MKFYIFSAGDRTIGNYGYTTEIETDICLEPEEIEALKGELAEFWTRWHDQSVVTAMTEDEYRQYIA